MKWWMFLAMIPVALLFAVIGFWLVLYWVLRTNEEATDIDVDDDEDDL